MSRLHHNRFFPTPKYLERASVGIDISDRSIKFIALAYTRGELTVDFSGEKKIPKGVIESGKLKDSNTIITLLKEIRTEHGCDFVRASLPEEQMYLFELAVPKMSPDEIRGTIDIQLEEHVPLSAQDVVFDYDLVEEKSDSYKILVTVIPSVVVEEYTELFYKAGFTLLSLELEASALARATIAKNDENTYMMIDFGDTRSGISIIHKRIPLFTSTVSIGGSTITEMIAKNFSVSYDDAEKMKKEIGLSRSEKDKELFSVIISGLSVLRDEMSRHYIYWNSHKDAEGNPKPAISSIRICGGNANLDGIVEYFKTSLRVDVDLANVWVNMSPLDSYIPPINFKESLSYATAIGLALGDFEYD